MKIPQDQKGFTIIELLVTILIFSIIVLAVSGIFGDLLNTQRRALASQKIQENGLYIMELMTREIRVSSIQNQDAPNCDATTLTITHPVNGAITYSLSNGVLQRTANGVTTNISSSDVQFSRLNFCIMGSGPIDGQASRVTIIAAIRNKTGRVILTTDFETTITSRDIQSELQQ